jgi:hypothetical protein
VTGRRRSLSLVLNGTFDRALEVAAELEESLMLAGDQPGGDGTLFRVRALARDLEGAFMDALAIRGRLRRRGGDGGAGAGAVGPHPAVPGRAELSRHLAAWPHKRCCGSVHPMPGVVKGYSVRSPSFNAYDNADPWVCLGYRREVSSRDG